MMKKIIALALLFLPMMPVFAETAKEYREKAEKGDVAAMRELGRCYEEGRGVAKMKDEAKYWYNKAAKAGDGESAYLLAMLSLPQQGKSRPNETVLQNLTTAIDAGYAPAMDAMGCFYMAGNGVAKDEKKALKLFQKAAEGGNVNSMFRLGMCYMQGTAVEQSNAKAVEWFGKAAAKDHVEATALKGSILLAGEGVEKNEAEGLDCLRKAAEKGSVMACRNLGIAKLRGLGIEVDAEGAVENLRVASAAGDAMALFYLGCCYAEGVGTEKDSHLAGVLLNAALSKGIAKARAELDKLPEVEKQRVDDPLLHVKAAAEWGNPEAQYQLARYYLLRFEGEETDALDADFWMRKAAANGHEGAKRFLEENAKRKQNPFAEDSF